MYQITYDLVEMDNAQNEAGQFLNGQTDNNALKIRIRSNNPEVKMKETLVHELMHAMMAVNGLNFERFEWDEEGFIRRTSPVLASLLHDNPELVKYLAS